MDSIYKRRLLLFKFALLGANLKVPWGLEFIRACKSNTVGADVLTEMELLEYTIRFKAKNSKLRTILRLPMYEYKRYIIPYRTGVWICRVRPHPMATEIREW